MSPTGLAVAGDDVEDAGREQVLGELGHLERRERRELRRLQHDAVPGRERRTDLPDRHHQRVVPRGDQPRDPDGLAPDEAGEPGHVLPGRAALLRARRAAEEPQVVDDRRELLGHRDGVGLADVLGLELDDLLAVLLDPVGELQQGELPVLRGGVVPGLERLLGGGDGAVRVLRGALLHAREDPSGRRVDHVACPTIRRVHPLAVDEHLIAVGHAPLLADGT